jgi:hypothetical protein
MKGFVNKGQSFWSYSKEETRLGLGYWGFLVDLGSVYTTREGLVTLYVQRIQADPSLEGLSAGSCGPGQSVLSLATRHAQAVQ